MEIATTARVVSVTRENAGERLDLLLRRRLADVHRISRTRVQRWIDDGQVSMNGLLVRSASTRPTHGAVVVVQLPVEAPRPPMAAEPMALDVLFEDDLWLAVNKPAGLVVHPTYKHSSGTLLNGLLWRARSWPRGQRPSLVGRLDRLTSGVVLVAKTGAAHARLQQALGKGESQKDYLALVYGRVRERQGRIDLPLGRDPRDARRVAVAVAGATSLTRFERLAAVAAPKAGLSLLRCRLVTGRTHQIRVHLAARGWPIVGDPVYGEPRWSSIVDLERAAGLRAFPRQALHAWRVTLPPLVGAGRPTIEAPLPADFDNLMSANRLPRSW